MTNQYFTYILASKRNGTLYIGVTNNLNRRVLEHKAKSVNSFSKTYSTNILVYYEIFSDIRSAINREKQLKKWNRIWKLKLIEDGNPKWEDLIDKPLM
jgi:putative endonuclease